MEERDPLQVKFEDGTAEAKLLMKILSLEQKLSINLKLYR